MRTVKRVVLVAGLALAAVVYIWFAAVRAVPEVKRRRAERRAARLGRQPEHPLPDE